jgi:hypothetical protein
VRKAERSPECNIEVGRVSGNRVFVMTSHEEGGTIDRIWRMHDDFAPHLHLVSGSFCVERKADSEGLDLQPWRYPCLVNGPYRLRSTVLEL